MNKKVLVLALASVVGAPMLAHAQGSVTVYGRLYPEIGYSKTTGATAVGTPVSTIVAAPTGENLSYLYQMNTTNSRLGFRGTEPLGGGWRAIFQLEQTINFDQGTGNLASRDSFVGLSGDNFGTVKLGFMDTVYKQIGDQITFFGTSSGNIVSASNVLSKSGAGVNAAGSFHLRRGNSVIYESPSWSGFSLLGDYSPDETRAINRNAWLVSVGGKYENGPWYLALAYEEHRDTFGGSLNAKASISNANDVNARSKDKAWRGTLAYNFGNHRVEADVSELKFDETSSVAGRFQDYKHWTYQIGVESSWSDTVRTAVSYVGAEKGNCSLVGGAVCSTDGLDGQLANLGAAYYFSKRTFLFALYSHLWNGKSARYNNLLIQVPSAGADTDQLMLGITHNF